MKIENNISGKNQDYYTTMSRQEKRQRAESYLKEVLDKKKRQLSTPHQSTGHTHYYDLL